MSTRIESADNCIIINGVLYPKGVLRACIEGNLLNVWEDLERTIPLINGVPYSDIIHVNAGAAFASINALTDFVKEHFFFKRIKNISELINDVGYLTSETDPTVPGHVKTITTTNISHWNTAYGWGNHAGLYPLLSGSYDNPTWINSLVWSKITGKPTSLSGYGITDAYTKTQINNFFSGTTAVTGYNKANWDAAYATSLNAFLQNGNSFGNTAVLGTNDNHGVSIKTNGLVRLTIPGTGIPSAAGNVLTMNGTTLSSQTPAQIASTAGAFMYNGIIPGSADLNTYTTTGFYLQPSNANAQSGTNYPTGLAGILEVEYASSIHIIQRYTTYQASSTPPNGIWFRYQYDGIWGAWQRVYSTKDFDAGYLLAYRANIPASADLNTYITTGIWHQNSTANAASGTNYPVPMSGQLEVLNNPTGYIQQRYSTILNGQVSAIQGIYVRSYYSGAWQPWKRIWTNADFTSTDIANWNNAFGWGDFKLYGLATGVQNNTAEATDALIFSVTEFKRVGSSAANLPVAHNGYLFRMVRSSSSGGEYRKVVFYADNGETWENVQVSGVWGGWRKHWDSSHFTSTDIVNWNTAFGWSNHVGLYVRTQATLAADASKNFTSSVKGIEQYTVSAGFSNYPSLGQAIEFSHGTGSNPSNWGRDFTIFKNSSTANNKDFYLRAYNTSTGASLGFDRIWHSGDFTSTNISNWNTAYSSLGNYLPLAGGVMTGQEIFSGTYWSKRVGSGSVGLRILKNPLEFVTNGTVPDAIVISHAAFATATMVDMKIKFFDYNTTNSTSPLGELSISFYQQNSTIVSASAGTNGILMYAGNITNVQVRVGFDSSGKLSVVLGDVGNPFGLGGYYRLRVEEIVTSHTGGANNVWETGWSISNVNDLSAYTNNGVVGLVNIPIKIVANQDWVTLNYAPITGGSYVPTQFLNTVNSATYTGNLLASPVGTYTALVSTSATNLPYASPGGMISFGSSVSNASTRILGARDNSDNLWFQSGDGTGAWRQLASRDWVTAQGYGSASSVSGTTGNIAKFTSSSVVGNSLLIESGSMVYLNSTAGQLGVNQGYNRFFSNQATTSGNGIGVNLYYTGGVSGTWQHHNTAGFSGNGTAIQIAPGGSVQFIAASGGTSPATITTIFTINNAGNLTNTGTITAGSIPALGSAATTVLTHTGGLIQSRAISQIIGDAATTLDSSYFKLGGNSFGANANLGTDDDFSLTFQTNNTIRGGFGNSTTNGGFFLGSGAASTVSFYNTSPITGGTTAYGNYTTATIQSDVTSTAYGYRTGLGTQAASFNLSTLIHYQATQGGLGAGSSVTSQVGFNVNDLNFATTNYGFLGGLTAGTGKWNLYMNGTAQNYLAGNLGIGVTTPDMKLHLSTSALYTGITTGDGLLISNSGTTANLVIGINSGSSNIIQSRSGGGSSTAYGLSLNPFGGAIYLPSLVNTTGDIVTRNSSTGQLYIRTAAQIIADGGGALASSIGNGTLTLATSGIAIGSASFTANQSGNSTFTVNVPGTDLSISATNGGEILSSTGTDITLTSLGRYLFTDADDLSFNTGFRVYANTTGSLNFPFATGGGIDFRRSQAGSSIGNFQVFKASGNDGLLKFRVGTTGTAYSAWEDFASQQWVAANYPLSSSIGNGTLTMSAGTGLTGTASFTANQSGNSTFSLNNFKLLSSNVRYGSSPQGGGYNGTGSSMTGAIRIQLPTISQTAPTMLRFRVSIYNYFLGTSEDFLIGGYNYPTSNSWINRSVTQLTPRTSRVLPVHFYRDANGAGVVLIGDFTTTWAYPQVAITELQTGYSGSADTWFTQSWGITMVSSAGTDVLIGTENFIDSMPVTDWSKITGIPSLVSQSTQVIAGNGLTGGGSLSSNVTLTMGIPGSITLASTNSVTTTSHTHALALGGTSSQYLRGDSTLATFPTIPAQYNPTQGTGITITGAYPNHTISANVTTALWNAKQLQGASISAVVPTVNQVLVYDGSEWVAVTPPAYITLSSLSSTSPIIYNNATGAIGITQATTSTNGYLSSTDWNTFSNKQAQLNGTGFVKITGTTISYDNTAYLALTGGSVTGITGIGGTANTNQMLLVRPNLANRRGLTIQGLSGQTGNLQEWQNNSSGLLSYINASGQANFATGSYSTGGYSLLVKNTITGLHESIAAGVYQTALSGNGILSYSGTTPAYIAGTTGQLLRRNATNTAYEFFTPNYLTGINGNEGHLLGRYLGNGNGPAEDINLPTQFFIWNNGQYDSEYGTSLNTYWERHDENHKLIRPFKIAIAPEDEGHETHYVEGVDLRTNRLHLEAEFKTNTTGGSYYEVQLTDNVIININGTDLTVALPDPGDDAQHGRQLKFRQMNSHSKLYFANSEGGSHYVYDYMDGTIHYGVTYLSYNPAGGIGEGYEWVEVISMEVPERGWEWVIIQQGGSLEFSDSRIGLI